MCLTHSVRVQDPLNIQQNSFCLFLLNSSNPFFWLIIGEFKTPRSVNGTLHVVFIVHDGGAPMLRQRPYPAPCVISVCYPNLQMHPLLGDLINMIEPFLSFQPPQLARYTLLLAYQSGYLHYQLTLANFMWHEFCRIGKKSYYSVLTLRSGGHGD